MKPAHPHTVGCGLAKAAELGSEPIAAMKNTRGALMFKEKLERWGRHAEGLVYCVAVGVESEFSEKFGFCG